MEDLKSIERYCAYQERSQKEVREKLTSLGVYGEEREALIAEAIAQDWVNEERFARAVVRGKFRGKGWGRRKISAWLRAREVSPYCIDRAMEEIDEQEYREKIRALIQRKWERLKPEEWVETRKAKTFAYLTQKGYEPEQIREELRAWVSS